MNKISYILSGVLIGLLISHFLNKSEVQIVKEGLGKENTAKIYAEKTKAKNLKSTQQKPMPVEATKPIQDLEVKTTIELAQPKPATKQKLELTITEELVKQLEKNWYDLPQQVKLESESDGWRVSFVDEASLFAETGLRAGDFISQQSIQNLKFANVENNYLSDRVIRILNHVQ